MILFHAKCDGTVTTTPNFVPQGSSMQDLVVVSEFDYAYCAIKLLPASGEYIEDITCTPILQKDFSTIFTAPLPPKATVVAGSVDYQLIFTAADGTTQTTLVGSFTVPRGVPVSTPGSVEELSVKTVGDLYTIMANTYGLFVGHEGNIYKNTEDIASLKKTVSSAGYVTIPVTQWEDGTPTIAEFTLDGFGKGMSALLMPADSNTQTAAREARLRAFPDIFRVDDDTQIVEIIRANAEKAPKIPLRFAYMILKTSDTTVAPTVAIIGVDAYGEGGGGSGGGGSVDPEIINQVLVAASAAQGYADEADRCAEAAANAALSAVNSADVAVEAQKKAEDHAADAESSAEMAKEYAERAESAGGSGGGDVEQGVINNITERLENAEENIGNIENTIGTIVGFDKNKTIRAIAVSVIAEALSEAPESLNSLEEIAAWIAAHPEDVAAIVKRIGDLETNKLGFEHIVDATTSNSARLALSANQGRLLMDLVSDNTTAIQGKQSEAQVSAAIAEAVKNLAKSSDIPKKVSQLTNDSGFLTPTTGDQRYAKKSDIPTVPQTLPNPYALTILGKSYTGGKAVSLTAEEIMEAIKIAAGGVVAYLDGSKIVLSGNLPDATYTAYYEVDGKLVEIGDLTLGSVTPDPVTYTIYWRNYNNTLLETDEEVPEGVTPNYDGATPTKPADDQYTYTFAGWSPTVVAAVADATYTAQYTKTAIESTAPYDFAQNFTVGRFKSDGTIDATTTAATVCTDYIGPIKENDEIFIKGFGAMGDYNSSWYNASKTIYESGKPNAYGGSAMSYAYDSTNGIVTIKKVTNNQGYSYLRVGGKLTGTTADVVVNIKRNGEYLTGPLA